MSLDSAAIGELESELTEVPCPYPGMRPYEAKDAPFFVGREGLIEQLFQRLHPANASGLKSRFVAVVGPSGSGKSSLVRAGLIPKLRRADWPVVLFCPATSPVSNFARAILETLDLAMSVDELTREIIRDPCGMSELLEANVLTLHHSRRAVIVVDWERWPDTAWRGSVTTRFLNMASQPKPPASKTW